MKNLTSAQLFAAPKRAGRTKARLERAKLVIVAARERAAETTQQCAASLQRCAPLPCCRGADWAGGSAGSSDGQEGGSILSCWRGSGPSTSSSPCIANEPSPAPK